MKPNKAARAIIDSVVYVTVATVSESNEPWNTPVAAYHFENDDVFYWASWTENQHSCNIRANGRAFLAIYDSTPEDGKPATGVYVRARVEELTEESDVIRAALVFEDDPFNPSDGREYLGDKPRRIYRATPLEIWCNADGSVDGDYVDVRVSADEGSEKSHDSNE